MSWWMGSHTSRLALWLVRGETGPSWQESCVGVYPQLPLVTSGPSQDPGKARRAVFVELLRAPGSPRKLLPALASGPLKALGFPPQEKALFHPEFNSVV